jgi:hypothetical protein
MFTTILALPPLPGAFNKPRFQNSPRTRAILRQNSAKRAQKGRKNDAEMKQPTRKSGAIPSTGGATSKSSPIRLLLISGSKMPFFKAFQPCSKQKNNSLLSTETVALCI